MMTSKHYVVRFPWLTMCVLACAWAGLWPRPCRAASFEDRTAQLIPGLANSQSAWGDFDNDGFVDLEESTKLWRNNGGTNFTSLQGLGPGCWGDCDNDGYLDFLVPLPCTIWRHLGGSGVFVPASQPLVPLTSSVGGSAADFNGDGFIDFYVGGFENASYEADVILQNGPGMVFSNVWQETGSLRPARGVTSCDFDEDGDMDVYVSNYRLEANYLWRNAGDGTFTDAAAALGVAGDYNGYSWSYGHTIGSAWGDLDNDGHMDLFVGNFRHDYPDQDPSKFYRSMGPSGAWHFEDKSAVAGLAWQESYATPALGDYDNDGDLDLFFTTVYGGDYPVLYRNDGDWHFTDVTSAEGLAGLSPTYQAAWADFDNDGDLDLVAGGRLFVNLGNTNHWLKVRVEGAGPINRAAIGTQVRIPVGGGTLTRQVEAGTGQGNQNDLTLHFGLGAHGGPAVLDVFWPNGLTQRVDGVPVDGLVTIDPGPVLNSTSGATGVTDQVAWLTGDLAWSAGTTTAVTVYWGPSNEGETTNWPGRETVSIAANGSFSVAISGLSPNTVYYYRCYASNVYGEAWSGATERFTTTGVLPFQETFEARALGDIDYQYGWRATASNAALVQTHTTYGGSAKACSATNARLRHAFDGPPQPPIVWLDMHVVTQPTIDTTEQSRFSPLATALLLVDTAACVVVYNGTTPQTLSSGPTVATGNWTRFTLRLNYALQQWGLWMNTTNMARHLAFYSTAANRFRSFNVDAGSSGHVSVLDNVMIAFMRPGDIAVVDDDEDGMDDDLEYLYFGSTTNSSGGAAEDWDDDGFIDRHELLAGTNPTDPSSLLAISNTWPEGQTEVVLTWYSVSNKWYAVLISSNLVASWSSLVSNLTATPPLNVKTVAVEAVPSFYQIMLEK